MGHPTASDHSEGKETSDKGSDGKEYSKDLDSFALDSVQKNYWADLNMDQCSLEEMKYPQNKPSYPGQIFSF